MDTIDNGPPAHNGKLVIVGASAGGVEALALLVSTLPTDFSAPILLAQHLDPHRPSSLGWILQQRSHLPVLTITAHTALQAGTIYVVPPDCYVTLNDGYVEMQDHLESRPKPSLDVLLTSAAHVYGKHLIAAILTGSGSDGAAGAIEVNRAGGTIIIQNPYTARFPSMPSAVLPAIVDFQVDLERIGPLLTDLLTGSVAPVEEEEKDVLSLILEEIRRRMSIEVNREKTAMLLPRLEARMLATNSPSLHDYLHYLQAQPSEISKLAETLSVHTTSFFQDPELFAFLKQAILPALIQRARLHNGTLRGWVIGCGSGEEVYSLAMVIADLIGAELPYWQVKIFATDLNEEAISFARHGCYPENLLTGLPTDYLARFFTSNENGACVSRNLRHLVIFGKHDFHQDAPFPHIDLALCRNVLPSFTADFQQDILKRLTYSLYPDGYLVLGREEKTALPEGYYARTGKEKNIFRCIKHTPPVLMNAAPPSLLLSHSVSPIEKQARASMREQQASQTVLANEQVHQFYELLFRSIPVGLIVIDRSYHILTANLLARNLLRMQSTPDEADFFHDIPALPYRRVREAVEAAFRQREPVTLAEVGLEGQVSTSTRSVTLSIVPLPLPASQTELAVISVHDVTEQVHTRRHLEAVQSEQEQLINELGSANLRMQDVNKALLEAEQALQKANEDMAMAQQELQAQSEEQETTIAELQASLQEIEAANEMLQMSQEEMQARLELQQASQEAQETAPDSIPS